MFNYNFVQIPNYHKRQNSQIKIKNYFSHPSLSKTRRPSTTVLPPNLDHPSPPLLNGVILVGEEKHLIGMAGEATHGGDRKVMVNWRGVQLGLDMV